MTYELITALQNLHKLKICHRDLKPENILIKTNPKTQKKQIKISDFGLSKQVISQSYMQTKAGTEYYMAPEML